MAEPPKPSDPATARRSCVSIPHRPSSPKDGQSYGSSPVHTLGWKEYVALPELGISRLKAKIDTGARTSALHISGFEVLERFDDGTARIEIRVPLDRRGKREAVAQATMLRTLQVTDSGGHSEDRPVIETLLVVGPVHKRVFLTLTDRQGMLFRMLLGRKALEGDFLIDVHRKYVMGGRRRRTGTDAGSGDATGGRG